MTQDVIFCVILHLNKYFASMLCESHFKSSFGNVKAFNLKKFKLSLSPAEGGPAAGGAMAGKSFRQFLGRTIFGLNPSIPFQKPLEVKNLHLGYLKRHNAVWGPDLSCTSSLPLNFPSGRQVSSFHWHLLVDLAVYQYAKFGALNRRINKTRSSENRSG